VDGWGILCAELGVMEPRKEAARCYEFVVGALFGDSLFSHHNNPIGIFGGGQTVRDDQRGSPDR